MLELMIAMVVFTIGFSAILSNLVTAMALRDASRGLAVATEAAQGVLEEMRTRPFGQVFALYNANPADDPDGPGSGPGSDFAVDGLAARSADPDGFAGEILFPGDGVQLVEGSGDLALGMPRDLNSDGNVDAADHADDYTVLPVRIRVEWRGRSGDQLVEIVTSIADV
jgi:hypothetical protein